MNQTFRFVCVIACTTILFGCRGRSSNTNETVSAKEFQSALDYWNRPNGFRGKYFDSLCLIVEQMERLGKGAPTLGNLLLLLGKPSTVEKYSHPVQYIDEYKNGDTLSMDLLYQDKDVRICISISGYVCSVGQEKGNSADPPVNRNPYYYWQQYKKDHLTNPYDVSGYVMPEEGLDELVQSIHGLIESKGWVGDWYSEIGRNFNVDLSSGPDSYQECFVKWFLIDVLSDSRAKVHFYIESDFPLFCETWWFKDGNHWIIASRTKMSQLIYQDKVEDHKMYLSPVK
jgi:hypothetical protein